MKVSLLEWSGQMVNGGYVNLMFDGSEFTVPESLDCPDEPTDVFLDLATAQSFAICNLVKNAKFTAFLTISVNRGGQYVIVAAGQRTGNNGIYADITATAGIFGKLPSTNVIDDCVNLVTVNCECPLCKRLHGHSEGCKAS